LIFQNRCSSFSCTFARLPFFDRSIRFILSRTYNSNRNPGLRVFILAAFGCCFRISIIQPLNYIGHRATSVDKSPEELLTSHPNYDALLQNADSMQIQTYSTRRNVCDQTLQYLANFSIGFLLVVSVICWQPLNEVWIWTPRLMGSCSAGEDCVPGLCRGPKHVRLPLAIALKSFSGHLGKLRSAQTSMTFFEKWVLSRKRIMFRSFCIIWLKAIRHGEVAITQSDVRERIYLQIHSATFRPVVRSESARPS
jgi:hypothetical protein